MSMKHSRQEYWSRLPCIPPGDLPNPGSSQSNWGLLHYRRTPALRLSGKPLSTLHLLSLPNDLISSTVLPQLLSYTLATKRFIGPKCTVLHHPCFFLYSECSHPHLFPHFLFLTNSCLSQHASQVYSPFLSFLWLTLVEWITFSFQTSVVSTTIFCVSHCIRIVYFFLSPALNYQLQSSNYLLFVSVPATPKNFLGQVVGTW